MKKTLTEILIMMAGSASAFDFNHLLGNNMQKIPAPAENCDEDVFGLPTSEGVLQCGDEIEEWVKNNVKDKTE